MNEQGFKPVCPIDELGVGYPKTIEIDDRFVVLVQTEDDVYCIDDVCTHDGGTLSDGDLEDHCLVCPRHGAKFDMRTGEALTMPATEPTASHEVRIVDGMVYVKINTSLD